MKIIKIQTQTDLEIKNPSEPIFTFISVKCKQKFLSSYTGVADSDNPWKPFYAVKHTTA